MTAEINFRTSGAQLIISVSIPEVHKVPLEDELGIRIKTRAGWQEHQTEQLRAAHSGLHITRPGPGDVVEATIRSQDPSAPYNGVKAKYESKWGRYIAYHIGSSGNLGQIEEDLNLLGGLHRDGSRYKIDLAVPASFQHSQGVLVILSKS